VKVVFDANVFVSAAIQKGTPHRIVQAWLDGADVEVVVCVGVVAELRDVLLTRPRMRRWIDVETAEAYIVSIEELAEALPDPEPGEAITRDVDDDYIVLLARREQADFIVTGDKDLLDWEAQTPPVISPVEFEALLMNELDDG
jgi:putative PIN family toxin of toxin-antitoxin system